MSSAFMSMQLAASSLGLGTMWVSAFRNPAVDGPAKELLNIPSHLHIFEMLAIGHPGMKAGKKKMRELADTLHFNGAENYRTQEDRYAFKIRDDLCWQLYLFFGACV